MTFRSNTMNTELNELKEKLEDHEERIKKLETQLKDKTVYKKKKNSIKEFIISKKPKNDVQKTLIIGYYLEKHNKLTYFNVNDILNGFKAAKEKAPSRKKIYDKIASNIGKGYIMDSEDKKDNTKTWELTNSGERYVQNDLKEIKE